MRKQSLHSIQRALEQRQGKYTAEDTAWLLILGSPVGKNLHTQCVKPIEADDDSTNGKDQEAPQEEKEGPSEEGTSEL